MENRKDIKNPGQSPTVPPDKGEDSEDRRNAAAEQSWRDKQGIPRGTPEQSERSVKPEVEDETNESASKRAPEVDKNT